MNNGFLWLKANAKVNLLLDVLNKRPDGYHELEGVMQSVSLCDNVYLRRGRTVSVASSAPLPENNTLRRAAEAFFAGSREGAEIFVEKLIPSEAGLGGASADAAAVLRGLNLLYKSTELERTHDELMALALSVGADVPFCIDGGCAIARGVGEKLTPLPSPDLTLLIVKGSRGVSTGRLFASLGVGGEKKSRLTEGALERAVTAIREDDAYGLAASVGNALQPAAEAVVPEIGELVGRMKDSGALGASMTGSGAAVFGIFESEKSAKNALPLFEDCEFAAVCTSVPDEGECAYFRAAVPGDGDLIARLKKAAWETTYRGIYPDELIDGFDPVDRSRRAEAMIESPEMLNYVIECGGEPAGFVHLKNGSEVYLTALYLLKEYRGTGVGSAVFGAIRRLCRERGISSFTCHCNAHNAPALAFYGRMGGVEISRSVGHENRGEDQIELRFEV